MPTRRFQIPLALFEGYKKELNMTHAMLAAELGISEVSSKRISSNGEAPEQTARMLAALVVIYRHPKVLQEYRSVLNEFAGTELPLPAQAPKRISKKVSVSLETRTPVSSRRVFRGKAAAKK